jgi:hypothetical protein
MGFNKRELPDLKDLKMIRLRFNNDIDFIKYVVGKSDALTGPSESHRYLEEIYEKVKKSEKNGELCKQ